MHSNHVGCTLCTNNRMVRCAHPTQLCVPCVIVIFEMVMKQVSVKLLLFLISIGVSGCTFVPRVSEEQAYLEQCRLYTRHLELDVEEIDSSGCGNTNDVGLCLLVYAVGVPAVTFVVSGSIVIAGNTIHWMEYQGRCENSELSTHIKKLKHGIENI